MVSLRNNLQSIQETGPKALWAMASDLIHEIDHELTPTVRYYQTLDSTELTTRIETLMEETEERTLEIECKAENMEEELKAT